MRHKHSQKKQARHPLAYTIQNNGVCLRMVAMVHTYSGKIDIEAWGSDMPIGCLALNDRPLLEALVSDLGLNPQGKVTIFLNHVRLEYSGPIRCVYKVFYTKGRLEIRQALEVGGNDVFSELVNRSGLFCRVDVALI